MSSISNKGMYGVMNRFNGVIVVRIVCQADPLIIAKGGKVVVVCEEVI